MKPKHIIVQGVTSQFEQKCAGFVFKSAKFVVIAGIGFIILAIITSIVYLVFSLFHLFFQ